MLNVFSIKIFQVPHYFQAFAVKKKKLRFSIKKIYIHHEYIYGPLHRIKLHELFMQFNPMERTKFVYCLCMHSLKLLQRDMSVDCL